MPNWTLLVYIFAVWTNQTYEAATVDDAKKQIEDLKIVFNATRFTVEDSIGFKDLDIMYSTMYAKDEAEISFTNQKLLIQEQVTSLKTLAETSGVDISVCLQDFDDYIEALPDQFYTDLDWCVGKSISSSSTLYKRNRPLFDKFYSNVLEIESQLESCESEACVDPILDYIEKKATTLKETVEMEQARAFDLYDILKLVVTSCQDSFVAEFAFNTTFTLNTITDCVTPLLS